MSWLFRAAPRPGQKKRCRARSVGVRVGGRLAGVCPVAGAPGGRRDVVANTHGALGACEGEEARRHPVSRRPKRSGAPWRRPPRCRRCARRWRRAPRRPYDDGRSIHPTRDIENFFMPSPHPSLGIASRHPRDPGPTCRGGPRSPTSAGPPSPRRRRATGPGRLDRTPRRSRPDGRRPHPATKGKSQTRRPPRFFARTRTPRWTPSGAAISPAAS